LTVGVFKLRVFKFIVNSFIGIYRPYTCIFQYSILLGAFLKLHRLSLRQAHLSAVNIDVVMILHHKHFFSDFNDVMFRNM
jgi:hypothetical protein